MKVQNTAILAAAVAVNQAAALPNFFNRCTPVKGSLEYAVQYEPFTISGGWPEFDASVFQKMCTNPVSQTPYRTCKAGISGGNDGDAQVIYGHGGRVPMEYLTIQHRGYIMSEKGGDYTVELPSAVDNALLFWQGEPAISGYTTDNAKFKSFSSPASAGKFTITVGPGEAVPIRFMFANAWGPGSFSLDIKDPSGKSCFCNGGEASADCFYTEVCDKCKYGSFSKRKGEF